PAGPTGATGPIGGNDGEVIYNNGGVADGSDIFFDDTNNRVGIGTTTPSTKFHVVGQTRASSFSSANGTAGSPAYRFESDTNTGTFRPAADNYAITTGGSERMRIDASGNVGIGTSTPTSKLQVDGNVDINSDLDVDGGTLHVDGTNDRVGIGTTSPQQLLVLRGDETASGEQLQISSIAGSRTWGIGVNSSGGFAIRDETGFVNPIQITPGAVTGSIFIGTNSVSLLSGGVSSFIKFSTNATERMRIDVNGNLGIGTTSPASKLEVNGGDIRVTGGSFIDDGTTLNVPDYVFEPDYKLESIEEHDEFMWREKHLPAVKGAKEINTKNGYNMAERREQILEELEKAHVYIAQLHDTIQDLKTENSATKEKLNQTEAELNTVKSQVAEFEMLKSRMARIEAALQKMEILTAKRGNEYNYPATETALAAEGGK
ncbi:MAG: cell division protein ZapB, partial [bacterium]